MPFKPLVSNVNLHPYTAAAVAEAAAAHRRLQECTLAWNGLGDGAGGERLAHALARNDCLRVVDLAHNSLGGAFGVVLAASLRTNRSLQRVVLDHNPLGEDGGAAIIAALQVGMRNRL